MTASDPLADAATRYHAATTEQDADREALATEVVEALRANRPVAEIVKLTGYTARHIRTLRGDNVPPRRPGRKPKDTSAE